MLWMPFKIIYLCSVAVDISAFTVIRKIMVLIMTAIQAVLKFSLTSETCAVVILKTEFKVGDDIKCTQYVFVR